jgi:hypothetical protein
MAVKDTYGGVAILFWERENLYSSRERGERYERYYYK